MTQIAKATNGSNVNPSGLVQTASPINTPLTSSPLAEGEAREVKVETAAHAPNVNAQNNTVSIPDAAAQTRCHSIATSAPTHPL